MYVCSFFVIYTLLSNEGTIPQEFTEKELHGNVFISLNSSTTYWSVAHCERVNTNGSRLSKDVFIPELGNILLSKSLGSTRDSDTSTLYYITYVNIEFLLN